MLLYDVTINDDGIIRYLSILCKNYLFGPVSPRQSCFSSTGVP